jgi:molybdate transport system substrate-binding protein
MGYRIGKRGLQGLRFAALTMLGSACAQGTGSPLRLAVASNFADAARLLADGFTRQTGDSVAISAGSTGTLYTQIHNGAPFDLFMAADTERPARLEQEGQAASGSRFTYAVGRLVLLSATGELADSADAARRLKSSRRLAIANPALAPYGAAAKAVLEGMGLWDSLQSRLITGENISQTLQFVQSGNAEFGFVALSQVIHDSTVPPGATWLVPQALYPPIEQQAVMLHDTPVARAFIAFLKSDEARVILVQFGYGFR